MNTDKYPLVYVEWEDSYSVPQSWHTEEEMTSILDDECFTVKQVGFILKETDKYIVLANQLNELNLSANQYSGLHRIPKGCLIMKVEITSLSS